MVVCLVRSVAGLYFSLFLNCTMYDVRWNVHRVSHSIVSLDFLCFYVLFKLIYFTFSTPRRYLFEMTGGKVSSLRTFFMLCYHGLDVDCSQKSSVPENLMVKGHHPVVSTIKMLPPGHSSDHSNFINSKFESDKFNN